MSISTVESIKLSTPPRQLGLAASLGWGAGSFAPAVVLGITNLLLLPFMTDYLGIGAGVAAALIAFSKIFDAATDPIMGVISDRTKTRIGRRRPYVLVGGALLALCLPLLFLVGPLGSTTATTVYAGSALIFFALAYTIFNVPYLAMPVEMTDSPSQRSKLISYRVYAVMIASIAANVGGPKLIALGGGGLAGYQLLAFVLSPVLLVVAIVAYWATSSAPYTPHDQYVRKEKFGYHMKMLASNKPFLVLLLVKFLMLMVLGIGAVVSYFFLKVLGSNFSVLSQYYLVLTLVALAVQPVWLWCSNRFGKRPCFQAALLFTALGYGSWWFAEAGEPTTWIYARAVLAGIGGGGSLLLGQSMLPDTMQYDMQLTGINRAGFFSGLYTTVEKLAGAIGVSVVGGFLGYMGYVQTTAGHSVVQPGSAILAIRICLSVFPVFVSLAAFFALFAYRLNDSMLNKSGVVTATGSDNDSA